MARGADRITLHLRGPRTNGRRLWELGTTLLRVAKDRGTKLLVNDRVDLALALDADGAHLGGRSLPVSDTRRILGPEAVIGVSVHAASEAEDIARGPQGTGMPDFVFAGNLFETRSHSRRAPTGVGLIRMVQSRLAGVPVLGIGGVTKARIPETVGAGAHGIAVIRAVWSAADAGSAVQELLDTLDATQPDSTLHASHREGRRD